MRVKFIPHAQQRLHERYNLPDEAILTFRTGIKLIKKNKLYQTRMESKDHPERKVFKFTYDRSTFIYFKDIKGIYVIITTYQYEYLDKNKRVIYK